MDRFEHIYGRRAAAGPHSKSTEKIMLPLKEHCVPTSTLLLIELVSFVLVMFHVALAPHYFKCTLLTCNALILVPLNDIENTQPFGCHPRMCSTQPSPG